MRTLLTHTQALPEASLVAWPETALAAFAERGLPFQLSYALKKGPELIAGALRSERTAGKTHRYNAAYHARGGEVLASYDKRYRMPFVESDPFGELPLLARFWGAQRTPYAAGTRAVVFDTVAGRVAPILCIEASEASLVRSSVRAGAQWLLVMSNDAWFGDSLANRVLAQLSRFRAVENRRDVVRVANLGVGGFIDAAGRARWVDDRNGPLHAQGEVTLRSEQTPYTRYGDVFAWLCAACALGVLLLNMWRMWSRRRNGRGRGSGEAARGL